MAAEITLQGNTLGERHRSLNRLISEATVDALDPSHVATLSAKSQIDQVYLVKAATRLRLAPVICEFLKSEDALVASKALECAWFFEGVDNRDMMNVDYVFDQVFPHVTYATRLKMISRMGRHLKDARVAEEFYGRIKQFYNFTTAAKLLPACSPDFIRGELAASAAPVPVHQLKYVYKAHPDLVVEHLERLLADARKSPSWCPMQEYEDVFTSLARDRPSAFLRLYRMYYEQLSFGLGYRTTCVLVKADPRFVVDVAAKIQHNLNARAVYDAMNKDDYDGFIKNMFPAKPCGIPSQVLTHLRFWKPDYAIVYLLKIYEQLYEDSLLNTENFPTQFVNSLPAEMRLAWANFMMSKKGNSEEVYLKYQTPEVAIKKYKELMQSADDIYHRITIFENMIECCKINSDEKALLAVMKFAIGRFRNDNHELRYRVMCQMERTFDLSKLSSEHWKSIDEMLAIIYYNKDIENNYRQYFLQSILKEKIKHNLSNKLEIDDVIDTMMKYDLNNFNLNEQNVDFQRKVLDTVIDKYKILIVDTPLSADKEAKMTSIMSINDEFNEKYKTKKQSMAKYDWFVKAVNEWFTESDIQGYSQLLRLLWKDEGTRKIFWKSIAKVNFDENVLEYLIKNDINTLVQFVDSLLEKPTILYRCYDHCKKIKTYISNPLGDHLKQKLIEKIDEYAKTGKDPNKLMITLSLIANTVDYENLVKNYLPESKKIDYTENNDEKMKKYQTTVEIVTNFKRMNPPISYDIVLKFAQSDFLKSVLPSLLSLSRRKNYSNTIDFIKALSEKLVSAKKQSVRLAYFLFDKSILPPFYMNIWDNESNPSIRKVIFQRTFCLLQSNIGDAVTRECWNAMKHYQESFGETDKNLFEHLTEVHKVADQLKAEFAETSWKTLQRLHNYNIDVSNTVGNLLSRITCNIDLMNEEFCDTLIDVYLKSINEDSTVSNALRHFCITYIMKTKSLDKQTDHTKKVCDAFKLFIAQNWNVNIEKGHSRQTVAILITTCCNQVFCEKLPMDPMPVLLSLEEMLTSTLPFEVTFDLHMYLKFTMLTIVREEVVVGKRLKLDDPLLGAFMNYFANELIGIMTNLIEKYGKEVHDLFLKSLKTFISYLFYTPIFEAAFDDLKLLLAQEILNVAEKSSSILRLALDIMPLEGDMSKLHLKLIGKIIKHADKTVKMILYSRVPVSSSIFV